MAFARHNCSLCNKHFYTACSNTLNKRKSILLNGLSDSTSVDHHYINSLCRTCFIEYESNPEKLNFEIKLGLLE